MRQTSHPASFSSSSTWQMGIRVCDASKSISFTARCFNGPSETWTNAERTPGNKHRMVNVAACKPDVFDQTYVHQTLRRGRADAGGFHHRRDKTLVQGNPFRWHRNFFALCEPLIFDFIKTLEEAALPAVSAVGPEIPAPGVSQTGHNSVM